MILFDAMFLYFYSITFYPLNLLLYRLFACEFSQIFTSGPNVFEYNENEVDQDEDPVEEGVEREADPGFDENAPYKPLKLNRLGIVLLPSVSACFFVCFFLVICGCSCFLGNEEAFSVCVFTHLFLFVVN